MPRFSSTARRSKRRRTCEARVAKLPHKIQACAPRVAKKAAKMLRAGGHTAVTCGYVVGTTAGRSDPKRLLRPARARPLR